MTDRTTMSTTEALQRRQIIDLAKQVGLIGWISDDYTYFTFDGDESASEKLIAFVRAALAAAAPTGQPEFAVWVKDMWVPCSDPRTWAAAAPSPADPWQPIETAPMDGTEFLGYRDGQMADAHRVPRDDCEMWSFGPHTAAVEFNPWIKPTHWMPRPAAPGAQPAPQPERFEWCGVVHDNPAEPADEGEVPAEPSAGPTIAGAARCRVIWYEGPPLFPQDQEWFIAETIYGDRVVLKARDGDHDGPLDYKFTTADHTYMAAKNVARWMQFPDCEYLPPTGATENRIDRLESELAQARAAVPTITQERLHDIIGQHIGNLYCCTRVWDAWSVGTMSKHDFTPVDDTDFQDELATRIMEELAAAPNPPAQPAAAQEPVAEVQRGGSEQFGRATVLVRWLSGAQRLPDGLHNLYASPVAPKAVTPSEPLPLRKFVEHCLTLSGGMVSGNRLKFEAEKVLAQADNASSADAREAAPGLSVEQEPKYTVNGRAIVNRASGEEIPADEPVFIFRARDRWVAGALGDYAASVSDPVHKAAVEERFIQFGEWAEAHPERMKEPDTADAAIAAAQAPRGST